MSNKSRLGMNSTLRNISEVQDMYESEAKREERLRDAFEENVQAMAATVCVSCVGCPHRVDKTVTLADPMMMRVRVQTDWSCRQQAGRCPDGYNMLYKEWELGGRMFNENAHNHDTKRERRIRISDLRRSASACGQLNIDSKGVTNLVDKDGEVLIITGDEIKVLGDEMMEPKSIFMSTPTSVSPAKVTYDEWSGKWNDAGQEAFFHQDGMAKDGYEQLMEERARRDVPNTPDAGTW